MQKIDPVLSFFLLFASSLLSPVLAQDCSSLLPCGAAFYHPTDYVCYPGNRLCPILNDVPTLACGDSTNYACYTTYQYSCSNGALAQLPALSGPFTLTAVRPGSDIDGKALQAGDFKISIGPSEPATYCPSQVPASACGVQNETIFFPGAMDVEVPGGQQLYIQTSGALVYTQAHSAATYNVSSYGFGGPIYQGGGAFGPGGVFWQACPYTDYNGASYYQVFADLPGVTFASNCETFYAEVNPVPTGTVGAWQYT